AAARMARRGGGALTRRQLELERRESALSQRALVLPGLRAQQAANGIQARLNRDSLLGCERSVELGAKLRRELAQLEDAKHLRVRLVLQVADREVLGQDRPERREAGDGLLHARDRNPHRQIRVAVAAARRAVVDRLDE